MATISANALGVYQISSAQTSPMDVITLAAGVTVISGYAVAGTTDQYAIFLLNDGSFLGIGQYTGSPVAWSDVTSTLVIMSAATSTSLEASNTVNETVARNGSGASTTYIISGAMSWSMSIDGLLDLSSLGVGTATGVMDAARNKEYVLCRFDTGTQTSYLGQALIDSISITGGVDDIATYSASFSGNGDLYKYTEV